MNVNANATTGVNETVLIDDNRLHSYIGDSGEGHANGGVWADLNNDGYPELYLIRGNLNLQDGFDSDNKLYLNKPKPGAADPAHERIYELHAINGVPVANHDGNSTGAIAGDYDNDGDLDLYITNYNQPNALLKNQWIENLADPAVNPTGLTQGDCSADPNLCWQFLIFVDVTASTDTTPLNPIGDDQHGVGIAYPGGSPADNSMAAAWADVNRDGLLDLYVGNHNTETHVAASFTDLPGRGQRNTLYLNEGPDTQGDWKFRDVTEQYSVGGFEFTDGSTNSADLFYSSCNALMFFDYDNDGWPDLMVTNQLESLGSRNMLYRNLGDNGAGWLGFQLMTWEPGFSALAVRNSGGDATMGIDVGDFDNDGDFDWSETDTGGKNDLYLNRDSNPDHSDPNIPAPHVQHCSSLEVPENPTSWGTQWQDLNNDGLIDQFYVSQSAGSQRNYLYMNAFDGVTQQFIESAVAFGLGQSINSYGLMSSDYNQDGLVDLFTVVRDQGQSTPSSWLYENQWPNAGKWLSIKLIGDPNAAGPNGFSSTKDAIGARVTAWAILDGSLTSPVTKQIREVVSGNSNGASTSSLELEFGFGQATEAALRVEFPSGQTFNYWIQFIAQGGGEIGQGKHLTIDEATATPADINCNGIVDSADLNIILSNLGCVKPTRPFCPGDINLDGVVDDLDVQMWLNQ